MSVYIPSFQVFRGRPSFFLPSGFQWTIIFGSRVGSILSTWPNQISCFRVVSFNIISCPSIFPLIYSFVFLLSLEILADRLNLLKPNGYVMHHQFNIQQFYILSTQYLMCFVFIWEQTATCATYSINWLVFITEMKSVYSAVRTGSLNTAVFASSLKG